MRSARGYRAALLTVLLLAALVATVPAPPSAVPAPDLVPAADTTKFDPGLIITDAVFYDSEAMTAGQVQAFLDGKVPTCRATTGPTCLKSYRTDTQSQPADSYCRGAYSGAARETAAAIIVKVARACDINPRVLLVTLQKEMGFITSTAPTEKMYTRAMGYGCPDNAGGTCSSYYPGLFRQLYFAAKQFQRYRVNPGNYYYRAGRTNSILWNPKSSCGSSSVYIKSQATAGLYVYTPYRPNSAALRAGYGTGDSCSSYGNRNFWNYFTDWFGTTLATGRDVEAPLGRLDAVSGGRGELTVTGWAFDPSVPTQNIAVQVHVDGRLVQSVPADVARPDVQAAYARFGIGPAHGFSAAIPVTPGDRAVCVYAVNVGEGYSNPNLGCRTVRVTDPGNPLGRLDVVSTSGSAVSVWGWALDPDALTSAVTVKLSVDGRKVAELPAQAWRADVGRVFAGAGDRHGFVWSGTLAAGTHRVCAYAVNQGPGSANPGLGCRTVTTGGSAPGASSRPSGRLDVVSAAGSDVSVWGWAFDPDLPQATVPVVITVDGADPVEVPAHDWRPDIGAKFPDAGDRHAFTWSATLSPGTHEVCATATNLGAGPGDRGLGCRSVTVDGTPPGPASTPEGRLDLVRASGSEITVWGWALDRDLSYATVPVTITVDGQTVAEVPASDWRLDVAAARPDSGERHGYLWSGTLPAGSHRVCTIAGNLGAGPTDPELGCRTVTVGSSAPGAASRPVGRLDTAGAIGTGVSIWGWTYDPDVPLATSSVRVTVDGAVVGEVPAHGWRADVGRARPEAGDRHGFVWSGTLPVGTHEVCAYGVDLGAGAADSRLGCREVTVSGPAPASESRPRGFLDLADTSGTTVTAAGWSFDPDVPLATAVVHFYVDGVYAGQTTADRSRPDVGAAFPGVGDAHGFSWTGTVPAGEHRICAYGINQGAGAGNPRLSCRLFTTS